MKAIFHNEKQSGAPLEATTILSPIEGESIISKRQRQMHNLHKMVIRGKPHIPPDQVLSVAGVTILPTIL